VRCNPHWSPSPKSDYPRNPLQEGVNISRDPAHNVGSQGLRVIGLPVVLPRHRDISDSRATHVSPVANREHLIIEWHVWKITLLTQLRMNSVWRTDRQTHTHRLIRIGAYVKLQFRLGFHLSTPRGAHSVPNFPQTLATFGGRHEVGKGRKGKDKVRKGRKGSVPPLFGPEWRQRTVSCHILYYVCVLNGICASA